MTNIEYRYRFTYIIMGLLRFLSHKELMRVIGRAFRRARMPLAFSHGFHPHPMISFGPPRPVGTAGKSEQFDVRLVKNIDPAVIMEKVSHQFPNDIRINKVVHIPLHSKSISASITEAEYELDWPETSDPPNKAIETLLSRDEVLHMRVTPKGVRHTNIRAGIYALSWNNHKLYMRLALSPDKYVRPVDVLCEMTGWCDDELKRVRITRIGLN